MSDAVYNNGQDETTSQWISRPIFVSSWGAHNSGVLNGKRVVLDDPQRERLLDGNEWLMKHEIVVDALGNTQDGRPVCLQITGVFRQFVIWFPEEAKLETNFKNAERVLREVLSGVDDGAEFKLFTPRRSYFDVLSRHHAIIMRLKSTRSVLRLKQAALTAASFPFIPSGSPPIEVLEPVQGGAATTLRALRKLPLAGWIMCSEAVVDDRPLLDDDGSVLCEATITCNMDKVLAW
jgi:hypothetical protein